MAPVICESRSGIRSVGIIAGELQLEGWLFDKIIAVSAVPKSSGTDRTEEGRGFARGLSRIDRRCYAIHPRRYLRFA